MIEYKDSFMRQYLSRSVEVNYNDFKSFVDSVMNTCIPTKRTSSRFNNTLKRMCRKKQRLFNRAKRTKSAQHWEQYKSFKRDTMKAIRKHRWSYINNVLQLGLDQRDTKPFWKYVDRIMLEWHHLWIMVFCTLIACLKLASRTSISYKCSPTRRSLISRSFMVQIIQI